jgi:hypothetical protein
MDLLSMSEFYMAIYVSEPVCVTFRCYCVISVLLLLLLVLVFLYIHGLTYVKGEYVLNIFLNQLLCYCYFLFEVFLSYKFLPIIIYQVDNYSKTTGLKYTRKSGFCLKHKSKHFM